MSLKILSPARDSLPPHGTRTVRFLAAALMLGIFLIPAAGHGQEERYSSRNADYFISSYGSDQLMFFNEITGAFLGVLHSVQGPVASQIGFGGDLYLSAARAGNVLRFDGFTGAYKGIYIRAGAGGLISPSAPNFGPDNLVYVGDTTLNQVLRFDRNGNFIDVFADQVSSGLSLPFMQTFDDTSMYIASGGTNSVLRYDCKTKKFLGAFVPPGSGGLVKPIGLEFGPDGNLYVGSDGTNAVLRYNGKTGEFMDAFVPPGTAGLSDVHAIRFGGPNSNLYAVSTGTNQVMEFDRVTGKFLRVVADGTAQGLSESRGLTFTPRPIFNVYAHVGGDDPFNDATHEFKQIYVEHRLKDYSDPTPRSKLVSITYSDASVDIGKAVAHARIGEPDYDFNLDFANKTGTMQHYTITYVASNQHGLTALATTQVDVPPQ